MITDFNVSSKKGTSEIWQKIKIESILKVYGFCKKFRSLNKKGYQLKIINENS